MALNLSTLTNASTSATVLAEAQTTADFLDSVPILKNLARRSNKGGDAKQTTALNQPKALPYDGKGYLYLSGVSGNYASVPNAAALNVTGDIELIGHADTTPSPTWEVLIAKYRGSQPNYMLGLSNSEIGLWREGSLRSVNIAPSERKPWVKATHRVSDNRVQFFLSDDGVAWTQHGTDQTSAIPTPTVGTQAVEIGSWGSGGSYVKRGQIYRTIIKDGIDGTPVLDVDFTATNVRHGDTKFKCATGQTVTINQSGNDPATVIKKSVLRFDGADDGLQGLFANNIDGGYMFAAFSVLGDGGEDWGRVFTTSLAGSGNDYSVAGTAFSLRSSDTDNLQSLADSTINIQNGMFDDSNGDILHVVKVENGSQTSAVNNAGFLPNFRTTTINSDEFNIGFGMEGYGGFNAAIDLYWLALFPATITDAEAARVVNYINNRNNVFDLKDSLGYYFFDPTDLAAGPVASWNGQIIGSDNDANLTITQTTAGSQPDSNQPTGSGMAVTFNDNNDHLDVPAGFVEPAAGSWQVVGTSLGTFAYKVNANAVTELNLLGNLGSATYRQAGDLYGIILLPETATGADIEAARKLLIDRGAADGALAASYYTAWHSRNDIVEFKSANTSSLTNCGYAWSGCSNLGSFPSLDLSSSNNFVSTWEGCSSMSNFGPAEMSNGTNFSSAWKSCSALTSFPAGAQLGTAANNVNFTSAWQSSGLTSFPALDLSNGNNFSIAFKLSPLTSFPEDILLGTNSTAVRFDGCWMNCSGLTSFPDIDLSEGRTFNDAWRYNTSLVNFPALFTNWSPSTVTSSVFNETWTGCSSLSSTSVENILTSIDSSGVFGTYTGLVTGTALPDAGIDIDYNVATGALSAATNTAINSLIGKGWQVYINGVLTIPNVLSLAPAAAYSLRSFDSAADPDVVNVRRSSDSATSDFKASEVSDGTLTTWVNTEYQTVTNGEFTTDSGWTKGAGWSIANGKATSDGTQTNTSYLYQLSSMGASQSQRVTLVVSGYSAGNVIVRLGDSAPASSATPTLSSNGTYVFTLPSHSTAPYLFLQASSDFQGSIESISVVQLTADGHVTTWYDQGGTNHAAQATASYQPKIVDGGTLVTEGGLPSINFPTEVSNLGIAHSDLYGQATLDSYYVTNATGNYYIYPSCLTSPNHYGMVADSGSGSTNRSNYYGSPDFYANGSQITGTTRNDIYTATSGGQKLVAHIGAYTTDPNWGTGNMNFGNYANNAYFGYTGKLQEMIFFNTDQSTNRTGIEKNINDTYTIY